MNFFILICARGGSKGIKNKNLKKVKGLSLLAHTLKFAHKVIGKPIIVVSSDSEKILNEAKKYSADVLIKRPKFLASDSSPEILTWKHSISFLKKKNNLEFDFFISLPTTSPFRSQLDISRSIVKFNKHNYDGILNITESNHSPYFNMVKIKNKKYVNLLISKKNTISRRQDAEKTFNITTIAYLYKTNFILKSNNLFDGKIGYNIVPKERSLDIDDHFDLKLTKLLKKY